MLLYANPIYDLNAYGLYDKLVSLKSPINGKESIDVIKAIRKLTRFMYTVT
jgi:hypothetical protein